MNTRGFQIHQDGIERFGRLTTFIGGPTDNNLKGKGQGERVGYRIGLLFYLSVMSG